MVYLTTRRKIPFHQMTFDELFDAEFRPRLISQDHTATHTYTAPETPEALARDFPVDWYIDILRRFNERTEPLRQVDRFSLYEEFSIPKKSGGLRRIDAPCEELKQALTALKNILEQDFHILYHTTAFAYIRGRGTLPAVRKHQQNKSQWFAKLDLHDFFGSTTLDFAMSQLSMVYPLSEVVKREEGREELRKALEMGFLRGGLPQGTPLSPTLTNIMMIPVDHVLSKKLRERYPKMGFVYTRYADDFLISSQYDFKVDQIEELVLETLAEFRAPFELNRKKTRYGSNQGSGANWNLGLMLNKDNDITIGHKNKKRFQASLFNFSQDYKNGVGWSVEDIQHTLGLHSYYRMVEGETIDRIVEFINKKVGMDVIGTMRSLLAF